MTEGDANGRVALELARREGRNPAMRDRARQYLNLALTREGDDIEILEALTELDIEAGDVGGAIRRLNSAIGREDVHGVCSLVTHRAAQDTERLPAVEAECLVKEIRERADALGAVFLTLASLRPSSPQKPPTVMSVSRTMPPSLSWKPWGRLEPFRQVICSIRGMAAPG